MERMGHSSVWVTLGPHDHVLPGIDERLTPGPETLGRGPGSDPRHPPVSLRHMWVTPGSRPSPEQ